MLRKWLNIGGFIVAGVLVAFETVNWSDTTIRRQLANPADLVRYMDHVHVGSLSAIHETTPIRSSSCFVEYGGRLEVLRVATNDSVVLVNYTPPYTGFQLEAGMSNAFSACPAGTQFSMLKQVFAAIAREYSADKRGIYAEWLKVENLLENEPEGEYRSAGEARWVNAVWQPPTSDEMPFMPEFACLLGEAEMPGIPPFKAEIRSRGTLDGRTLYEYRSDVDERTHMCPSGTLFFEPQK